MEQCVPEEAKRDDCDDGILISWPCTPTMVIQCMLDYLVKYKKSWVEARLILGLMIPMPAGIAGVRALKQPLQECLRPCVWTEERGTSCVTFQHERRQYKLSVYPVHDLAYSHAHVHGTLFVLPQAPLSGDAPLT